MSRGKMNKPTKYISNKKLYEAMINYRTTLNESLEKGIDKPAGRSILPVCLCYRGWKSNPK